MEIKLIIGLGNPDEKYHNTYHNIGHLFVDFVEDFEREKSYQIVKTGVYMNKSGEFVKDTLKKSKVRPINLLIVQDDSDIELGHYKFSFNRNSGGHKGIDSIINHLKTKEFWRLRIGIRPPRNKDKADVLVLKKISPANKEKLTKVFKDLIKTHRFFTS